MRSNGARRAEMLILSRKVDEVLRIGDDVTVTVLSVKGNQVRLGIKAPRDVSVLREEVLRRDAELAADQDPPAAAHNNGPDDHGTEHPGDPEE